MIKTGKCYHFIGIGGAGMSGLARVMLDSGMTISGSDLHDNKEVAQLKEAGASVYLGHDARLLHDNLDGVIVSSAIGEENAELKAARRRNLPVVKRLHALASLLYGYKSIGIAGTHGKTTTTAMAATILTATGQDPSYLIGAQCPGLGGNSHLGQGSFFVTEVDESDGLFLTLCPTIAVLNNIGRDHLNTYSTLAGIKRGFAQYIRQSELSVLAIDNPNVRELAREVPNAFTVGICEDAKLSATNIAHHGFRTNFDLVYQGKRVCSVQLPAPGSHNVRNALCAIGACFLAGISLTEAARALEEFCLPERRFQLLEENGVTVVDDYAHLPEEIEATLQAIRDGWNHRRIVAIFQPHRYSRTKAISGEFGNAFREADTVLLTPIYPAQEQPIPGITSRLIAAAISNSSNLDLHFVEDKEKVVSFLKGYIEPGDFIISFGAGDIWTVTEELSCFLEKGQFCTV